MVMQVFYTASVVDTVIWQQNIVESCAIFRDIERQVAVAGLHPSQNFEQPTWVDFPIGCRSKTVWRGDDSSTRWAGGCVVTHNPPRVIVDTEEVDRRLNLPKLIGRPFRPRWAEHFGQFA